MFSAREGDLILESLHGSVVKTLVERQTRLKLLLHPPLVTPKYSAKLYQRICRICRRRIYGRSPETKEDITRDVDTIADLGVGIRRSLALAARHQRERQRSDTPVLRVGHRPVGLESAAPLPSLLSSTGCVD